MRCQHDLLGNFVELRIHNGRQRVVLTIDSAGLQGCIDLGESHRSWAGAQSLAQKLPCVRAGHPQVHTGQIVGSLDGQFILALTQVHLATAQIHHRKQLHAEFIFDFLLEGVHQWIVEDSHLVCCILMDIAGCKD